MSSSSIFGSGQTADKVVFTSPLTIRVTEEVSRTRKVEVDLETGRSKSFVEESRFEVLDLTGDTPSGRGSQRTPLGTLRNQASTPANISPAIQDESVYSTPANISPAIQDESVICLTSPSSQAPAGELIF